MAGIPSVSTPLEALKSTDLHKPANIYFNFKTAFDFYLFDFHQHLDGNSKSTVPATTVQSLSSKFTSFLESSLRFLATCLKNDPKIEPKHAEDLFNTYTHCIRCLKVISSRLLIQSYCVQLMDCYIYWSRFEEARLEEELLLSVIWDLSGQTSENGRILPDLMGESIDRQSIASLIIKVTVAHTNLVAIWVPKEDDDYKRVLSMIDEVQPWLRLASEDKVLYSKLVLHMNEGAVYRVVDPKNVSDFTINFCKTTLLDYKKLASPTMQFAFDICRVLLSSDLGDKVLLSKEILSFLMESAKSKSKKEKEAEDLVRGLLAEAYCLHAFSTKDFIEDIQNALDIWSKQDDFPIVLLFHVHDFLSLKGYMDFHARIYQLMKHGYKIRKRSLDDCLDMLWHSKCLGHGLCTSRVNNAFFDTFSTERELLKSSEYWKSRTEDVRLDFEMFASAISTIAFRGSSSNPKPASKTEDDVKKTAFDLYQTVLPKSMFLSSNLFYDLSERMFLKGSMAKALKYAIKSYQVRGKLLKKNFSEERELQHLNVDNTGEITQKRRNCVKSIRVYSSAALASLDAEGPSVPEFILSPWSVVGRFLESAFQLGTVLEIVGDRSKAEAVFNRGKEISSLLDLPVFRVVFHSSLGKIYLKQDCFQLAEKELSSAKDILAVSFGMSCMKCNLILKATVAQELGDLYICSKRNVEAADIYKSGAANLKVSEWRNWLSNPNETTPRPYELFCVDLDSLPMIHGEKAIVSHVSKKRKRMNSVRTTASKQESETAQKSGECDFEGVFDNVNCWHCVPQRVTSSSSLPCIIHMKWECRRRRLLIKLLIRLGNCLWADGKIEEAREQFLESISVLVTRNTFSSEASKPKFSSLGRLITNIMIGDEYAIDYAFLLFNICRFSIMSEDIGSRNRVDPLDIPTVIFALKQAFLLCREVNGLFEEVSKFLAVLYALSPSIKNYSISTSSTNMLPEGRLAAFFHQALLGAHVRPQMKQGDQTSRDADDSFSSDSTFLGLDRLTPESLPDLEKYIASFFQGLPKATIVCISILKEEYMSWLRKLSNLGCAWMMLSRLHMDCEPIVVLLPVLPLAVNSQQAKSLNSSILFESKTEDKPWRCPWGRTVVDEIAPLFRIIFEGDFKTSSSCTTYVASRKSSDLWYERKEKLDLAMGFLLRNMEDLWFGKWKHLLLGGIPENKPISEHLKQAFQTVDEKMLQSIIKGGVRETECLSELIQNKGCYFGGKICSKEANLSSEALKLLSEEITGGDSDGRSRTPVTLILDFDIQMLPWESLPLLRNKEVYRMPSISSILSTYHRCSHLDDKVEKNISFPMIDPSNAYCVLNPDGDLPYTREVSDFFENFKGIVDRAPHEEELFEALKSYDLYVYLGHNRGEKYISDKRIQELDRCATAFVLGCSSGFVNLEGSYAPTVAPLYYLHAGSPLYLGNLWDVTQRYWVDFYKNLFSRLKEARSQISLDCSKCTQLDEKNTTSNGIKISGCKHKPEIWSILSEAREKARLPYLMGAAPVCYGIPTVIHSKDS